MSLNGLNTNGYPLTLSGVTSLDVSSLTIDGTNIDLTNLVPYTGATQTLDMGSQNIKTTHTPVLGPDVINLTTLTNAVLYVDTANALTYLNKVTTTEQNVAAATTFSSTVTANYFYTDNSYNWGRPSSSYNAWAIGRVLNSGVIRDLQFKDDTAGVTTLLLSSTGQTVYVGLTCNYATGSKIPIFDSDRKLVSSGVDSIKITYLDNVSSDLQSQLNARAVLAGGNSFSGSQNYSDKTASTVAIFDGSKNLVSSVISVTELNYLGGLTSGVQGQINGKLSLTGGTMTGDIGLGANKITSSATPVTDDTLTRKGYVDSAISGAGSLYVLKTGGTVTGDLTLSNLTASRVLILDASKIIKTSSVTTTELDNLTGITANVQSQFNAIISALSGYLSIYGGTLQGTLYNSVGDFHPYKGGDTNKGCVLFANNADGISYTNYNGGLASWYGIGFKCRSDSTTRFMFDTRTGNSSQIGTLTCGGLTSSGNLTVADGYTTNISNGLIVSETNLGLSVSNLTGYSTGGVTAGSVSYNSSLQWWVINANSASGAVQVSGFTPVAGVRYQFTMSALGGGQSGQTIQWYQGTLSSPISSLYSVPFGSTTNFVGYFTPSNIVGTVFLLIQSPTSSNTYIYLDVGAGQTGFTLKRMDTNIPGLLTCGGMTALNVAGSVTAGSVNTNNYARYADYRAGMSPSQQPASSMGFYFGTINNGSGSYADLLCLNSWSDGSAGNVNMIAFNKGAKGIRQYQGTFGSGSAFSTYYDCVMTDANSSNVSISGSLSATGSLVFGSGGTYTSGCIYADSSWGCIIRAKTAGAIARFLWSDVNDIYQMRISSYGVLNFHGGASAYSVPNNLTTRAGALVIGSIDTNYTDGWNTGLLMECADTTGITIHDAGTKLASFMYYSGNRFYMGKDPGSGWGVTPITVVSDLTCDSNIGIGISPTCKLDVRMTAGSASYTPIFQVMGGTGFDASNIINFQCQASQYGRNIMYMTGRYEGDNDGWSRDTPRNAITFRTQSSLDSGYTQRWTIQNFASQLGFLNNANGNSPTVCFNNYGVGIGTTSSDATYYPSTLYHPLNVNGYINGLTLYSGGSMGTGSYYGYIQFVNSGHFIGNFNRAPGGHVMAFSSGAFNFSSLAAGTVAIDGAGYLYTYSDRRVKNTIEYIEDGSLDKVLQLKPCSFKMNQDPYNVKIGFIAQDVEVVIPDAVDGKKHEWQYEINKETGEAVIGDDGQLKYKIDEITGEKVPRYRGLDTTAILAHSVKAIQELHSTVEILTQRNKVLEAWARDSETKQKKTEADVAKIASLLAQMMAK